MGLWGPKPFARIIQRPPKAEDHKAYGPQGYRYGGSMVMYK